MNGATIFGKASVIGETTNKGARDKRNDDRSAAFVGLNGSGQEVQYLVVADGVTSTHGGDQASDIAVRTLQTALQTPSEKLLTSRMAEAIHQANQAIVDAAGQNVELKGMSTTLVLAAVEGDKVSIMHLGDSRAYLLRNNKAYQLTLDHTWIQDALDEGRVTPEQAATHPNRHVIQRYLGAPRTMSIDTRIIEPGTEGSPAERRVGEALQLLPGDALLLCSDGLYGRINSAELAAGVAASRGQPQRAADSLVDLALKRNEPDNITALLWTTATPAPAAVAGGLNKGAIALAVALALIAVAAFVVFGARRENPTAPAAAAAPASSAALPASATQAATSEDSAAGDTAASETAAADATAADATDAAETTAADATDAAATEAASAALPPAPTASATATPPPTLDPTATPVSAPAAEGATVAGAPITSTTVLTDAAAAANAAVTAATGALTATTESTGAAAFNSATDAELGAGAGAIEQALSGTPAAAATVSLATPSPAVAASAAGTPTAKPTSTPLATATPSPTVTPTQTPLPTQTRSATVAPTRTPAPNTTPLAAAAPPSNTGNSTASAGGPTSVTILEPPDATSTNSKTTFAWQADAPLAEGQVYEVAFWRPGTEPSTANAWSGALPATRVEITPPDFAGGSYRWGVWLGTMESGSYQRLRYLGGGRAFDVPGESDGGPGGVIVDPNNTGK